MLGNFSCFWCRLLTFFKTNFFEKILSVTLSKCQTVWIHIRTDVLSFAKVISRRQKSLLASKELNVHAQLSSGARSLNFIIYNPLSATYNAADDNLKLCCFFINYKTRHDITNIIPYFFRKLGKNWCRKICCLLQLWLALLEITSSIVYASS